MEKITVFGTTHAKELEEDKFIHFLELPGITDRPVIVRSNYGWKFKNKPREERIIYPPFKILDMAKRTIYTLGHVTIECSKIEEYN